MEDAPGSESPSDDVNVVTDGVGRPDEVGDVEVGSSVADDLRDTRRVNGPGGHEGRGSVHGADSRDLPGVAEPG